MKGRTGRRAADLRTFANDPERTPRCRTCLIVCFDRAIYSGLSRCRLGAARRRFKDSWNASAAALRTEGARSSESVLEPAGCRRTKGSPRPWRRPCSRHAVVRRSCGPNRMACAQYLRFSAARRCRSAPDRISRKFPFSDIAAMRLAPCALLHCEEKRGVLAGTNGPPFRL